MRARQVSSKSNKITFFGPSAQLCACAHIYGGLGMSFTTQQQPNNKNSLTQSKTNRVLFEMKFQQLFTLSAFILLTQLTLRLFKLRNAIKCIANEAVCVSAPSCSSLLLSDASRVQQ